MRLLMKKYYVVIITLILSFLIVSCTHYPQDRYNTQVGSVIGAGTGALIGQAIGGNSESTLIGLAAGTILGALVGNAKDQDYQAARDATMYGKPVIYYDKNGHAVEVIPEKTNDPNCQQVRKRIWEDGKLVKETIEEVCGHPVPVVRYYPPPPFYYYEPLVPYFYFRFGEPYYQHPYRYHRGRHHRYHRYHRYHR